MGKMRIFCVEEEEPQQESFDLRLCAAREGWKICRSVQLHCFYTSRSVGLEILYRYVLVALRAKYCWSCYRFPRRMRWRLVHPK